MKVVVISNKPPKDIKNNYSDFIDSCDVVIRVSKMENIDCGKTGSKTDVAIVMLNSLYLTFSKEERHVEVLKKTPIVRFIDDFKFWTRLHVDFYAKKLGLKNWGYWKRTDILKDFTTYTMAVYYAVENYPDAEIWIFGEPDAAMRTNNAHFHNLRGDDEYLLGLLESGRVKQLLSD